jgi:hypothetical protein
MNYGMITYGDLIYHSSLEWQTISAPNTNGYPTYASQLYQIEMNAPIASARVWDVIGEAQLVDIPSQMATFNPAQCFKPATLAIQ